MSISPSNWTDRCIGMCAAISTGMRIDNVLSEMAEQDCNTRVNVPWTLIGAGRCHRLIYEHEHRNGVQTTDLYMNMSIEMGCRPQTYIYEIERKNAVQLREWRAQRKKFSATDIKLLFAGTAGTCQPQGTGMRIYVCIHMPVTVCRI